MGAVQVTNSSHLSTPTEKGGEQKGRPFWLHECYDPEFVDAAVRFFVERSPGDPMGEIRRVAGILSAVR